MDAELRDALAMSNAVSELAGRCGERGSRRDLSPRLSQEPCDQLGSTVGRGHRSYERLLIMRGGGVGHEIAIAPTLLAAQRADALHVVENEGLGTGQIVLVDAECRQHLR
jgi:hypothetical protein